MTAPVELESFFHACSWLAVQTADATEVARLLGAVDLRPCTFAEAVGALPGQGDAAFFVCEPVDGWTLVFGETIGLEIPSEVRSRFGQVHAFHVDDRRSLFRCQRTIDGSTVREIASIDGEYSAEGQPDPGEPELPAQEGRVDPIVTSEQLLNAVTPEKVLRIAEAWGADPTQIVARVQSVLLCRTAQAAAAAAPEAPRKPPVAVIVGLVVAAVGAALALVLR